MRVLWSRRLFTMKHWLVEPSNVPDRCHWERTSAVASTCLVSRQLIGTAGGTLSLPIPSVTFRAKNCRVSVLCSFLQSRMGALRVLVLALETPGKLVQLHSWVSGRCYILGLCWGYQGSQGLCLKEFPPGRGERERGACKPWTLSK